MDANLAGQQTERILAIHGKGRRLKARFLTGLIIVQNGFETAPLCPAKIHPKQHVRPVLRFGAAGSGMDSHDGIAQIIFAGEQAFGFQAID